MAPETALNRLLVRILRRAKGKLFACILSKRNSHHLAAQSHGHVAQRADGAAQQEGVGHRPRRRTAPGVAVTFRHDGTRAGEMVHDGDWYHERHYS